MKVIHLIIELSVDDDTEAEQIGDDLFEALMEHMELTPEAIFSVDGIEVKG